MYSPRHSTALHLIRQLDVLAVDVELPLSLTEDTGQHSTGVYTHPHVDRTVGRLLHVLDGVHHRQAHIDAEDSVVRPFHRCSTYTVVTVAEDLYSQLFVPGRFSKYHAARENGRISSIMWRIQRSISASHFSLKINLRCVM